MIFQYVVGRLCTRSQPVLYHVDSCIRGQTGMFYVQRTSCVVFAINSHRRHCRSARRRRRSSKSTYSPGSGSRDCEHCEMDQWRCSATAVAQTSDDDDDAVLDSPIFDEMLRSVRDAEQIHGQETKANYKTTPRKNSKKVSKQLL